MKTWKSWKSKENENINLKTNAANHHICAINRKGKNIFLSLAISYRSAHEQLIRSSTMKTIHPESLTWGQEMLVRMATFLKFPRGKTTCICQEHNSVEQTYTLIWQHGASKNKQPHVYYRRTITDLPDGHMEAACILG